MWERGEVEVESWKVNGGDRRRDRRGVKQRVKNSREVGKDGNDGKDGMGPRRCAKGSESSAVHPKLKRAIASGYQGHRAVGTGKIFRIW